MLNIISRIFSLVNVFLVSFGMVWLFNLYIKNKSYVRDIFLICLGHIAGMFNVLCYIFLLNPKIFYLSALENLSVLSYSLFSLYLLTYISVSNLKWWGNILKSFLFVLVLLSMVTQSTVLFHVTIITVCIINEFFCWFNNTSKVDKTLDISFALISFSLVYALTLIVNSHNMISFFIYTELYNAIVLIILFNRIREVKSYTGENKYISKKAKMKKIEDIEYL